MTAPNQLQRSPCCPLGRTSDPFAVNNDRREPPTDGRRPQIYEALAEPAEGGMGKGVTTALSQNSLASAKAE